MPAAGRAIVSTITPWDIGDGRVEPSVPVGVMKKNGRRT